MSVDLPLYRVTQHLAANAVADIPTTVGEQLDQLGLPVPQGPVAITAGSRGIANIATILRAAGEWLRQRGAKPFLVPAMGSHNGATAEGQLAMLATLGITEQTMGMPLHASMEVVPIGQVTTGEVTIDRYCHQAAGVLVVNRVKPHTSFLGPVQSGLMKMIAVGMGKVEGARTFHRASFDDKPATLLAMARLVLATGKIWGGLAIVEDGLDQTAELHALSPAQIESREAELLTHYTEHYFPRLPVEELNVLLVHEMGKHFSGLGMDPNVIGRRGLPGVPDLPRPKIGSLAALNLAAASQGNALGVGLADCITQRLYDAIDFDKTRINAETTGNLSRMQIGHIVHDDQGALAWCCERSGGERIAIIPNTLHLERLWVSQAIAQELRQHPACEVNAVPQPLRFDRGRLRLIVN